MFTLRGHPCQLGLKFADRSEKQGPEMGQMVKSAVVDEDQFEHHGCLVCQEVGRAPSSIEMLRGLIRVAVENAQEGET